MSASPSPDPGSDLPASPAPAASADPATVRRLLRQSRTIAVVGLSGDPEKPSWQVARYLQDQGYRIIPVNPRLAEVLGEKAYPDLRSVPEPIDLIDVFRPAADCPAIAEQAVAIRARGLWLQAGIVSDEAAAIARRAGLPVVMDRCTLVEHRHLAASAPEIGSAPTG
jgi:predicted CoA-binding protein